MKSFMKMLTVAFILTVSVAFGETRLLETNTSIFDKMISTENVDKRTENYLYYEFVKSSIPEKFVDPFYEKTVDRKNLGLELIGMGYHESGWKVFRGPTNKDGSVDIGPLMLNSNNIKNKEFMQYFGYDCSQYANDLDIYYMTICINFYASIRLEYGPYIALQIYNGGYRILRARPHSKLKVAVTKYANLCYNHINKYEKDYKKYVSENEENAKVQVYVAMIKELEAIGPFSLVKVDTSDIRSFENYNKKTITVCRYVVLLDDKKYFLKKDELDDIDKEDDFNFTIEPVMKTELEKYGVFIRKVVV